MNIKLAKLLTIALAGTIMLSFAAILPVYGQADGDLEMINPLSGDGNFHFDTNTFGLGDTFVLLVRLTPVGTQRVYGWQLKIGYDTALLDCMGDALPAGHIFDGESFNHPAPTINEGAGEYFALTNLIAGYKNVSAQAPLVEITFKIMAVPTLVLTPLSAVFTFLNQEVAGGTYLLDDVAGKLDLDYIGGDYEFSWVAPSQMPYLELRDPVDGDSEIVSSTVGEVKEIDIYIHNTSASWEMISVQFQLWYNTTLLSMVGDPTTPDYDNGTFMENFIGTACNEMGIWYFVRADFEGVPPPSGAPVGTNYFAVGIMKMPNLSGSWCAPFPDGEGLLVTLKVETLLQGLFPIEYTCALEIVNATFYNQYGMEIVPGTSTSGTYKMLPKVLGRSIDVFTQYPDPFGGQGLGQNSDMFWPQKEVCLGANVTYNDWPEQGKDVAFQVIDPYGGTWAVLYNRTDQYGVAHACFTLPWPCDEFDYWFGEWTIIATVDIACEIKNDTLHFKYDYLVHITKITLDQDEYAHCEWMNITVEFKSYAMQTYDVVITFTALDETGVPFGFMYAEAQIGGATYCTYKIYEVEGSIHVVKWARAGTGLVYVGALSAFPFDGGGPLCEPFAETVTILAEWA